VTDTIVALSSGGLPAGVAVLRISGPAAGAIAGGLAGGLPASRVAALRALRDGGDVIDRGLVLWFPAPASFTGEDVAELQVHGGPAVVAALIEAATRDGRARLAEPGEFTRRAFDNGRLDLTAVEGLADLIAARTEAQRRAALRQADGGLARLAADWRQRLVHAAARLEAAIDFADEDLPADLDAGVRAALATVGGEIASALADGRRGELARDGVHVALVGPPNVGKSSLLNRLARREVAIVSEIAGTTRDVIEVTLDLGGWPVVVADTAGLREAADVIEAAGVARAEARRREADIPIFIADARELPAGPIAGPAAMILANKVDLAREPLPAKVAGIPVFPVSALSGEGLDRWIAALTAQVAALAGVQGDAGLITRSRHRAELARAAAALARAPGAPTVDLMAEDVRLALHAIGRLTGAVDVEDLLDVIFAEFCIGK
jgi:tRNA modification GTPase